MKIPPAHNGRLPLVAVSLLASPVLGGYLIAFSEPLTFPWTGGARSVVWLRTTDSDDEETLDFRVGFGAFAGSDFAEQVEAVGDELKREFQEASVSFQ
ncbi:hypothetical protein [Halalkalicoccus sp. NIPERK01]|uniref:hypothetical protein n=1 Tax=Halalkalicoccus sp. NIPERK01 TaxID=3053469 RepID=UPI00256F1CB4|nr:hypothetical protein [Halalkalicoccus sp. NIPERK01]MDL5363828.1 hypothetical protein [Halalkalicoccus sp. NIPERK01]